MGSYIRDSSPHVSPGKSEDGDEESESDRPGLGTLLSGRFADADCDSVELVRELREDE